MSRDHQRIARTAPQLQDLLRAAEFEQWRGKCPIVEAEGICGLGGARTYQQELWEAFAEPRQRAVYARIAGRQPAAEEERPAAMLTEAPDSERRLALAVAADNAAPRRLVNDYQVRALPFI